MNDRPQNDLPIQAALVPPPELTRVAGDSEPMADSNPASRLQSRTAVLLVLFVATGALGIPLLWVNKRFSRGERIFWSIAVLVYSIAVLALGAAITVWMWNKTMSAL